MSVHKIKECSKDPIFTATGNRFQMQKPSNSRILPMEKICTGVEGSFHNNVSINPNESRLFQEEKIYAGAKRGFCNNVSIKPNKK